MKTFYYLKNVVVFLLLLLTFATTTSAQTPQYYNTNSGTSVNTYPWGQPAGQRVHWLIRIGTLNQPSPCPGGNIDTIYFYMGNTATATFTNVIIKMGNLSITTLPAGWYTTQLDTVYSRASVTLSSVNSSWMKIPLDHPMFYDTSKALVIDVQQCGYSGTGLYVRQSSSTPATRNYGSPIGCPINYAGQDGQLINFGVHVSPPPSPFCQGFSSTTFPPTGWTIVGGTAAYWKRNADISGFGLGTGSAYYNMWSAPANENEELRTFTFAPTTIATDSIEFDYAYSPYPSSPPYNQDSLVVMCSTNNGTSWIRRAAYGPYELQTAPAQNNQFVPSSGQWGIKRVLLPVGTNKVSLLGKSAFGNNLFIDSVCVKHPVGIPQIGNEVPKVYSLSQNYPNPFNPATKISYAIPKSGIVMLTVYDILGREVITIVNELKAPGSYSITFNASTLPSGAYFYKIKSGDFSDSKKMVLIK